MTSDEQTLARHPSKTARREESAMTEAQLLNRITSRPDVFGGKPIIRDMRFSVQQVLAMLAAGDSTETILHEYPFLEPEDIQAYLSFAYRSMADDRIYERIAAN